jgi:hypothetical protein
MQLDGHYYFNLKIQEYTDFIKPLDLIAFSMKENCGAAGVVFSMAFQTSNQQVADLIIENNEVIIELGESVEKAKSYKAYISEHPSKTSTADGCLFTVGFSATTIKTQFYTNRTTETVFGTSLSMIKQMAKEYLETDVDVQIDDPAETEHNWLRSYETGAVAMMEAWLHMNLPKTTPLLWIDTNNIVHITDIEKIKANGPKYRFVPADYSSEEIKPEDIKYLNNFTTKSYKFDTNLITGENTIVNVSSVESGDDTVVIPENTTDIASTQTVEQGDVGNKVLENKYQTDNVHSKFMVSYYNNKLRLIRLSSHIGHLSTVGLYPDVNICDLVEVAGCTQPYLGRYIVNTKLLTFGAGSPVRTSFIVCRDNTNSIENADITPKSKVTVTNQQMTDILQSVRTLRRVTVMATKWADGTTKGQILGYCKTFKYNALSNFRVMGAQLNLNSSLELMQSLKAIGNKIINNIIDKYIPYPYNLLLHNLLFEGLSFKRLLSQLFYKYLPSWLSDILTEIVGLLADLANLADALHKQNSKKLSDYNYVSGGYSSTNGSEGSNASGTPDTKDDTVPKLGDDEMSKDYTEENSKKIEDITNELVDNMEGLDVPIPAITLDESDSLLPTAELKEVIAEKVVDYLDGQGYLTGVGSQTFLAMLLGRRALDFNTIKLINGNIGNMLYARYWGTYKGEVTQLGRIYQISDNIITMNDVDITDDLYNGDLISITGTDKSNGTYTVVTVDYDSDKKQSYIEVLEDINTYTNTPIRTYTTLCSISKIEPHVEFAEYDDVTAIYLDGNYANFLPVDLTISVTGTSTDTVSKIIASVYNKDKGQTVIYVLKYIQPSTSGTQQLQVVIETDNATSLSKLSNSDLTDFYIKNAFKDIYTTVPCTKTINALQGAKVWIALPSIEENIEFYINSQQVEMDTIEGIDLGLFAAGGAQLWYTVYISKDEYNSNNVTLEVRRKQT